MTDEIGVMQPMLEPMKPLTVIQVDHAISQEEAQQIHDHFKNAVHDDRPMIILGPDIGIMMLEPYRTLARRGWLALGLASGAIALSVILLLWVLVL